MSAKKQPAPSGWRSPKVRLLAAAVVVSAAVSGGVAWSLTDSRSHPVAPKPGPGDQYATVYLENVGSFAPSGTGVTTHTFTLSGSVPSCSFQF